MTNPNPTEIPTTVIAAEMTIEGNVSFSGIFRLHGKIKGDVLGSADSFLIIEKSGMIEGKAQGHDITIAGVVHGSVAAKKSLIIHASGKVIGDIRAANLQIAPGAIFDATCSMAALHLGPN